MRVFQYLSMFDFFVRYKAGKANVVSDALLRLSGNPVTIAKDDSGYHYYGSCCSNKNSDDKCMINC